MSTRKIINGFKLNLNFCYQTSKFGVLLESYLLSLIIKVVIVVLFNLALILSTKVIYKQESQFRLSVSN